MVIGIGEKENHSVKVTSPTGPLTYNATDQSQEVVLRRTQSFEADEKYAVLFNHHCSFSLIDFFIVLLVFKIAACVL